MAADRRITWLQAEIKGLGDNPHRGQSRDRRRFQFVLRYARATYVVRYMLTRDRVIVTGIWHGKENRPR